MSDDTEDRRKRREDVEPPRLWDFSGWLSGKTQYTVRLIGRPSAKTLQQLIETLQLYHQFMAEDELPPSPAEGGSPEPPSTDIREET